MRVLVTGADGFIGAQVVQALLAAGDDVLAVVLPTSTSRRLTGRPEQVTILESTLAALPAAAAQLRQWAPEVCLHLAWTTTPGQYLHTPDNLALLADSLVLFRLLPEVGCRRIVGAGTCAEYAPQADCLREDAPTQPKTVYAAAKLALALVGQQWAAQTGVRFAWGRVFFLYGPAEHEQRLVPAAIRALMSGQPFPSTAGEQVRDYLHVADVAAAFRCLAAREAAGVYNIASQAPVTVRALLEMLASVLGQPELLRLGALPYGQWDPPVICGDNQRLRQLGWQPRYDLRGGLAQTVGWWRSRSGV